LKNQKPLPALLIDDAINHAIKKATVVSPDDKLKHAVAIMEKDRVWDLPVVSQGALVGLLHLHPATKALLKTFE
jgi:CBS domain-containing protein